MIKEIIELPIVKALGWGWIVSLLGIVITLIWELNPVTTLTSTKFERILFSKEKKVSVRIIRNIGTIILSIVFSVVLFSIYVMLYNTEQFTSDQTNIDISMLIIAIVFLCSMTILFIVGNFNVPLKVSKYGLIYWSFNSKEKKLIWIFSVYLLYVVSGFSLLSSAFADAFTGGEDLTGDNLSIFIIILLTNNMFLVAISKMIFTVLIKKFARYTGETYYYDENDGQRWYIYHLAEKSTYLLGNTVDPKNTEVFTTIEKSELLSKKINVYRIPNELDQMQET
ncbi:MAG: hypothetical protein K6T94_00035 [Paenibacillus sp.]|nr:hypothetical protein [Paenibacillus sp.]